MEDVMHGNIQEPDQRVAAAQLIATAWRDRHFTSRDFHRWLSAQVTSGTPKDDPRWHLYKAFEALKRHRVIVRVGGSNTNAHYAWYTAVPRQWPQGPDRLRAVEA